MHINIQLDFEIPKELISLYQQASHDKFIGYVGAAAGLNGVTDPELIGEVVAVLESLRAPIVQE